MICHNRVKSFGIVIKRRLAFFGDYGGPSFERGARRRTLFYRIIARLSILVKFGRRIEFRINVVSAFNCSDNFLEVADEIILVSFRDRINHPDQTAPDHDPKLSLVYGNISSWVILKPNPII